ncbi:hypothetical protein [Actinacidiphila oryziradicis]|uniref:hypothetical protein n=1 Tax=Actinacidiphila oryziradicis TaxID=2571141 RepID=UPI00145C4AA7|nr:hypothetical protein [Actinacidiphila oryziradicis]
MRGDVTGRPPVPGRRLVTVGTGAVLATYSSEVEDNEPYVDLEYGSAEPRQARQARK